ncbi:unnamed protein product [Vitrella brassicaformis CCMP3155]|uniref:PARP n=2 Tax=Vitrella brassicaformis TaxID=1169539 RepID=A0A0G4G8K4_VITBC|nr:unnamed protein product [Vitrella brassicaformis CCMP3155]|eukprot:CEM24691.1 unnamed protein product [Vitrella brassicaformis CCMP3155]
MSSEADWALRDLERWAKSKGIHTLEVLEVNIDGSAQNSQPSSVKIRLDNVRVDIIGLQGGMLINVIDDHSSELETMVKACSSRAMEGRYTVRQAFEDLLTEYKATLMASPDGIRQRFDAWRQANLSKLGDRADHTAFIRFDSHDNAATVEFLGWRVSLVETENTYFVSSFAESSEENINEWINRSCEYAFQEASGRTFEQILDYLLKHAPHCLLDGEGDAAMHDDDYGEDDGDQLHFSTNFQTWAVQKRIPVGSPLQNEIEKRVREPFGGVDAIREAFICKEVESGRRKCCTKYGAGKVEIGCLPELGFVQLAIDLAGMETDAATLSLIGIPANTPVVCSFLFSQGAMKARSFTDAFRDFNASDHFFVWQNKLYGTEAAEVGGDSSPRVGGVGSKEQKGYGTSHIIPKVMTITITSHQDHINQQIAFIFKGFIKEYIPKSSWRPPLPPQASSTGKRRIDHDNTTTASMDVDPKPAPPKPHAANHQQHHSPLAHKPLKSIRTNGMADHHAQQHAGHSGAEKTLCDMGFDIAMVRNALAAAQGNVETAAAFLLGDEQPAQVAHSDGAAASAASGAANQHHQQQQQRNGRQKVGTSSSSSSSRVRGVFGGLFGGRGWGGGGGKGDAGDGGGDGGEDYDGTGDVLMYHHRGDAVNFFSDFVEHIGKFFANIHKYCVICFNPHADVLCRKLFPCNNELCIFSYEEFVATVYAELQDDKDLVDLHLFLAGCACNSQDTYVEPFPPHFLKRHEIRTRSGIYDNPNALKSGTARAGYAYGGGQPQNNPDSNKDLYKMKRCFQKLPSVKELAACSSEEAIISLLRREGSDEDEPGEASDPMLPYKLVQFVLATNRMIIRRIDNTPEAIPGLSNVMQLAVYKNAPEREDAFAQLRAASGRGSAFAFHGSPAHKWYSIMRNGIRNLSNTALMTAGAAHGAGVYLSKNKELSLSYCQGAGTTVYNKSKARSRLVLGVYEYINDDSCRKDTGHQIVTVQNDKALLMRFMLIWESSSAPASGGYYGGRGEYGSLTIEQAKTAWDKFQERMQREDRERQQQESVATLDLSFVHKPIDEDLQPKRNISGDRRSARPPDPVPPCEFERDRPCPSPDAMDEDDQVAEDDQFEFEDDDNDMPLIDNDFARPAETQHDKEQRLKKQLEEQELDKRMEQIENRMEESGTLTADKASSAATRTLMKEFRSLMRLSLTKDKDGSESSTGFEVTLVRENMYHWQVKLTADGFPNDAPLKKDLLTFAEKTKKEAAVVMDVLFPGNFPFAPPFIRVIRPRFVFHTGHITVGGSICMELLTPSGWRPTYSIESVLIQIKSEVIEGGGRIDFNHCGDYTDAEARAAYDRVARQHGWIK